MEIEFLLGKSKTGKSRYIYEQIKKDIDKGVEDILFVPSQKRLITEEQFMDELNLDGIIGVDITTISSFVVQNLKEQNLNLKSIKLSKLDKKLLLAKTVRNNKEVFNVFSKVIEKKGFLDGLYIYMDLFKKENININELKKITFNDKILEEKVNEIASIYEKYQEELKTTFANNIDEITLFNESIKNSDKFKGKNIFFDGYNNFTNEELTFIETLLKLGANIIISLTTDISSLTDIYAGNSSSIFEVANSTYMKLLKICDKNNIEVNNNLFLNNYLDSKESLKYLADSLFSNEFNSKINICDEGVKIYLKNNIYTEVRSIAKDISKKVRENNRYNDFVIYTTDVDEYSNVVKRIFYEYNIPYYIDTKKSIENSKLIDYIKKLIQIYSGNLNYENVLNILKLGLNQVDEKSVAMLDNYALEFNLLNNTLNKELTLNNNNSNEYIYDLKELNDLRKNILNIFLKNEKLKAKAEVSVITEEIYNHLLINNIFKKYDELKERLKGKSEDIYFEEQVYDKLNEIFESLNNVYKDKKVSMSEFLEIFKISLDETYIKSIPPTVDNVSIADINVSKQKPKKYSYFVQVNENVFPKLVKEDAFFSDFELEKLSNKDVEFKETSISKLNMSMYNIYEAIANTKESLTISILSSDSLGKALRPSNLITLIKQNVVIDVIGDIASTDDEFDIYSKEQVFENLMSKIAEKDLSAKDIATYEYFNNVKNYNEVLSYKKDDSNLNKESIESIYGDSLTTSVSRLEQFKKCPFSYFVKYSMNISEKVEYEISSLDTGTFMHNVLDDFSKYLLKNNISWPEILKDEDIVDEKYHDILYQIIEKELDIVLKKHKNNIKYIILKEKLVNTMKNVILIIAKSFAQSMFTPFGYEIEFDKNGMFAPIEIKINDNYYMYLRGKIDRVDIYENDEASYIRVVDYKSSSRTLDLDDVKEGLSLQLVTYLNAFIKNYKKEGRESVPAACVYFNLSDNIINIPEYEASDEKMKAEIIKKLRLKGIFLKDIEILEKMDNKIADRDSRMLDVSKNSVTHESKKTLEKEEFIKLSNDIEKTLKNIGSEMLSGVVNIMPNKKADHCKYCKYMSICRKESRL